MTNNLPHKTRLPEEKSEREQESGNSMEVFSVRGTKALNQNNSRENGKEEIFAKASSEKSL